MELVNRLTQFFIKKSRLYHFDFSKPWYSIFWQQKKLIAGISAYIIVDVISFSLFPLIIGFIIEHRSYMYLLVFIALFIFIKVLGWFTYHPMLVRLFTQTSESFRASAYTYFLSIDPVDHVQKPANITAAKIQRTAIAYLDLTDTIIDETLPIIIETIMVIVMMMVANYTFGIVVGIGILIVAFVFSFLSAVLTHRIEKKLNIEDDRGNNLGMQSIYRYGFIRATFSTQSFAESLQIQYTKIMQTQSMVWLTYRFIRGFFIVLYLMSLACIIGYLVHQAAHGFITSIFATTLVMTYVRGTKGIFSIDKRIKIFLRSYRRIKDFYSYARQFGEQTFPIFTQEGASVMQDAEPSIVFRDVTFHYKNKELFNQLEFTYAGVKKEGALVGIIGPSGVGKTTFLSILGGQVKPQEGTILIDGIDIYEVNDDVKRKLIALQRQDVSVLKGTVRSNLLVGLPNTVTYDDTYLIDLLKRVGLWEFLAQERGLTTELGEAGMTFSGGQRQRLNFVNLYMRALYYEPTVVLIDEPTSSLDEISERAITAMIQELAARSITFVIAHRLRTLHDAQGIIDFSLPLVGGRLLVHTKEELQEQSLYYRELVQGMGDLLE